MRVERLFIMVRDTNPRRPRKLRGPVRTVIQTRWLQVRPLNRTIKLFSVRRNLDKSTALYLNPLRSRE